MGKSIITFVLGMLIMLPVSVNAEEKWMCKPGWGNWEKKTEKVDGWTQFVFNGKMTIPIYHPPYDKEIWECKNWIKESDRWMYDDNGNMWIQKYCEDSNHENR